MIFRSLTEVPADFGPSAITIGNFDGVHEGHRHILRRVVAVAREHGWKPTLLTFDPHPTKLVAPSRSPKLLTTIEQRCELIAAQGIEYILILPFTAEVAKLTPEEFVAQILAGALRTRAVLVGDNFRFGNRAAGDTKLLGELGLKYGFVTEAVSPVRLRNRVVSSSEIRSLIEKGNMSLACRMLGRPYTLEGQVVPGHGVGSKQTVPTLNLATAAETLPKVGVYVTRTRDLDDRREWQSITNVGFRPTFGGDKLTIETFLLAPLRGEAPRNISVELLRYVREERKFATPEALKAQIFKDVGRAQAYFRRRAGLKPALL
jgi:riboflavin kinase/FMN adenylyltransferase